VVKVNNHTFKNTTEKYAVASLQMNEAKISRSLFFSPNSVLATIQKMLVSYK